MATKSSANKPPAAERSQFRGKVTKGWLVRLMACQLAICKHHFSIRTLQFVASLGLLLLLMSVPGCQKSSDKVAVHGHVSYRGQPLESASLTFIPASGRPEAASVSNGEYRVELGPGEYTAAVLIGANLPKGYKEGDPVPPPKIVLPETYSSPAKSSLKATVKAGQSEPIDFELK